MALRRRIAGSRSDDLLAPQSTGTWEGDKAAMNRVRPKTLRAMEAEKTARLGIRQQAQTALDTARLKNRGALEEAQLTGDITSARQKELQAEKIGAEAAAAEKEFGYGSELLRQKTEAQQGLAAKRLAGDLILSGQASGETASNIYNVSPGFDVDLGDVKPPRQQFGYVPSKYESDVVGGEPIQTQIGGFYTKEAYEPTFIPEGAVTDILNASPQQIEEEIRKRKKQALTYR